MSIAMRLLTLPALVLLGACAQTFELHECDTDDQCAARGDGTTPLYCTSDHFCVDAVPSERLCLDSIGPGGADSLHVATLLNRATEGSMKVEAAVRLAVDEINQRQAGAQQPLITVHFCDTASQNAQTVRAVRRAAEQYNIAAVVGAGTSSTTLAITPEVVARGILVISPAATAVDLASLDDHDLVWRTVPSDALQAQRLAAEVAKDMPAPARVDTLYVDSIYGLGLSNEFARLYMGPGGSVKNRIPYKSAMDLEAAVDMLAADQPSHAVLAVAAADVPALAPLLAKSGLGNTRFFMTDSARTGALLAADKTVLDRVRGTAPKQTLSTTFEAFASSLKARYMVDANMATFTASAYDALYLIALAASPTSGHVPTGAELAAGMRRVKCATGEKGLPVGATNYLAAQAKAKMGDVCLDGASGPLTFDEAGDLTSGAVEFWGIDTTVMPPVFKTL